MDNVVTTVFNVESEAYKAFTELRKKPFGKDYVVAEAALVKRENNTLKVVDQFDATGVTVDDTASGMVIGSLLGILGGPVGVLLGASVGAMTGSVFDAVDTGASVSMLEVTASKLYENECAIIALVQEEEPAFDAALEGYDAIIIRYFADDVYEEVVLARELQAELINEARQQLRAERKEARADRREQRRADIAARFDVVNERRAQEMAELKEAVDVSNAQLAASADKMLGRE